MPDKKIRFDDFELDYARFQLSRAGSPVRLEGLPLQLLMFLVEKRGQLVTRDEISTSLWSKDVFVDVEQGNKFAESVQEQRINPYQQLVAVSIGHDVDTLLTCWTSLRLWAVKQLIDHPRCLGGLYWIYVGHYGGITVTRAYISNYRPPSLL